MIAMTFTNAKLEEKESWTLADEVNISLIIFADETEPAEDAELEEVEADEDEDVELDDDEEEDEDDDL